ncbi:hypothetical protein F4804DRAFT_329406 [Jackrogersella minutella]|nr:hypothetical protein F4804DRAFT_329406 [Jackrogersella minutella]
MIPSRSSQQRQLQESLEPMTCLEIEQIIQTSTIYLAIHQRYDDPHGAFHWAIVVTLDSELTCVVYQANNPSTLYPRLYDWIIEENNPGQWNPWMSPSLLCLFEVKQCESPEALNATFNQIRRAGREVMNQRLVSEYRTNVVFNDKSFALDVLEKTIVPELVGPRSTVLEQHAGDKALRSRIQSFANTGTTMKPGWFKVFKLVPPTPSQSNPGPS